MDPLPVLVATILISISGLVSPDDDVLQYIGCYDLSYSLTMNYHHHIGGVTIESCIEYCGVLNTRFAGVEKSDNFCYCGSDINTQSLERDDSQCDVPCSDVDTRTCGGDWLMSLYQINNQNTSSLPEVGDLQFLVGTSVGVRLYNSTNFDRYDTVVTTGDWVHALDYHHAKRALFIFSRGKLYKASLGLVSGPTTPVKELSMCEGFAVDWVHDKIYWMDCNTISTSFMVMGLNGEGSTSVLKIPGMPVAVKRLELDPYKKVAFWIGEGTIASCTLQGKYYQTNMSTTGTSVRALTLDLHNRRVFYIGILDEKSSLFSMDYMGGDYRVHFSLPQMLSVYGLGILKGKVYWVNYADVKDVLYAAPVELNSTDSLQTLKTIDKAVWHMKLLHKHVQKEPAEDPCDSLPHICFHQCVSNATSARCACPKGMKLNLDEMSCSNAYVQPTPDPGIGHKTASGLTAKYVGCFDLGSVIAEDGINSQLMLVIRPMFALTFQRCIDHCETISRTYAGISGDWTCYCATLLPESADKASDELCNEPCPHEPSLQCGGDEHLSFYELQKNTPAVPVETSGVRFLVSHNTGVVQYNATNIQVPDVLMYTSNWSFTIDYHLERNMLFTYSGGRIFQTTLEPKQDLIDAIPTKVRYVSDCEAFAVDWVEDQIYWMDCNITSNTLMVMDLDGEGLSAVVSRPLEASKIRRMEMDPYTRIVFWIANGSLESCSLKDGKFHGNVSRDSSSVRALALDLEARRVFYVAGQESTVALVSVDYEGRARKEHLRSYQHMRSVYGLSIYDGHVYWVNYVGLRDVILRAPLTRNDDENVVTLRTIYQAVWHFKLVHPKLQSRPTQHPCSYKRCSHMCRETTKQTATCMCPLGMRLSVDDRTCVGSSITFGIVVLTVLMLSGIVLVAVVMVYLTDRYWNSLRLKVFNVPYTRTTTNQRNASVTSVYDTNQDDVVLI